MSEHLEDSLWIETEFYTKQDVMNLAAEITEWLARRASEVE